MLNIQVGNDILTYDPNSNITKKGTDTYVYDSLNQITQVKYTDKRYGTIEGNGYNYDLMGSRQSEENLRWITKTTRTGALITTEKKKVWNYTINSLNQYSDIIYQSGATSKGITNTGSTNTGTTNSGETSTRAVENGTGTTSTGDTNTGATSTGEASTGEVLTDSGITLEGRLLYDKNGNMIGNMLNHKRQHEYSYDYNNRLIQIIRYNEATGKEIFIQMNYDTLGRRTSKKVANTLTEYTYSGNDVIEETMSSVNPTTKTKTKKELREYVYGSRGMDDIISVTITPYARVNKVDVAGTSNSFYYEKDHLGSIARITTSTGGIIDEYSYTVFGKAYKKDILGIYKPLSSLKSSINNIRLYTGREYDRETNLYYHRARYYDANLGRFISRDPIGLQDDINLYRYVANSPIGYVDRMGLEKVLILVGQSFKKDNDFTYGINYQIQKYLDQGVKLKNIILIDSLVISPIDFNNAVDPYNGNIQDIVYLTHGATDSLGRGAINADNVNQLHSIKKNLAGDIATLTLIACNTGKGEHPIAQDISNQLGIPVIGANGYLDIGLGEGFTQAVGFPGMFDPFRKNGEPSFANLANVINGNSILGSFNTFNPLK